MATIALDLWFAANHVNFHLRSSKVETRHGLVSTAQREYCQNLWGD